MLTVLGLTLHSPACVSLFDFIRRSVTITPRFILTTVSYRSVLLVRSTFCAREWQGGGVECGRQHREWAAHCPGAQATYGKCGYVDFLKLCWERERQCDLTVAFTFAAHVVVTVDFRPCRPCVFCFSLWAIRVGPALHDCCLFFLFRSFFLFPCNSSLLWLSSHIIFRVLNFYLFWAKHTIFCFVFLLMAYAPLSLDVFVLLSGQFAEAVIAL